MKYGVKYSKIAIRDLDRIWNEVFNASKDYEITRKYIDGLLDKVEAKAFQPVSGAPLYYEDSFTGYYYVVFKTYLAFYKIEGKDILVDRVLFGASDYLKILNIKIND